MHLDTMKEINCRMKLVHGKWADVWNMIKVQELRVM